MFSPLSRSSLLLSTPLPLPSPPGKSFVEWTWLDGVGGAEAAELWSHYDKLMYLVCCMIWMEKW